MNSITRLIISALGVFVISTVLTRFALQYARKTNLLDIPNERSAHSSATPRGGGIGFVLTLLGALVLLGLDVFKNRSEGGQTLGLALLMLALAGALTAAVGWLDDRYSLSASKRLCVHFLSAGIFVSPFVFMTTTPMPALWVAIVILLIAGFINFYNFMDGIDGLAASEAVIASVALALCAYYADASTALVISLYLAAAALGFLIFNWPPAKIFMGDVGSGFLGLIFGAITLIGTFETGFRFAVSAAIALALFISDATVTLVDRARKGEKFWEAHSQHAYQHSARRWGHFPVTAAATLINILWLAPLAVAVVTTDEKPYVFLALAYVPLLVSVVVFKRPKREESSSI